MNYRSPFLTGSFLILITSGFYIWSLHGLGSSIGGEILIFALLPVLAAGWFWGARVAFVLGVVLMGMSIYLINLIGESIVIGQIGVGLVAIVFMGVSMGGLRNLILKQQAIVDRYRLVQEELKVQAESLEKSKAELVLNTDKLNQQIENHGKTKTAMLNLLEDARALEEELRIEKESVEKEVLDRTEELHEEESRLVSSIESLPLGYVLTDINDNVVMTNKAVSQVFGNPTNRPLVEYLEEVFSLHERCARCRAERVAEGPDEIEYENKVLRIFLTPVLTGISAVGAGGVVLLIEDVTEARMLERTRNEFFAVASHELRTPLTAIRGNLSLIQEYFFDQIKDENFKELINDMHKSSLRLIELVNDFLNVSRLEQKKIDFKKDVIDLVELIPKILNELGAAANEHGITLEFKKEIEDSDQVSVVADQERIQQVVINLVGNALKFTKEGAIVVSIEPKGKFMIVRVTDNGPGITKEGQMLLFRKFQQTSEHLLTRDVTSGTGLGLYISKLLSEGMGGKIYLDRSEVGKGSTFAFTLPLANVN